MIAVIFEVEPAPGKLQTYFNVAANLNPKLDVIDGFVSIERYQSLSDENRILSLSFWRDEDAVACWRSASEHRAAQCSGRNGVFTAYRLRVARVIRDYGLTERAQAPADSRAAHA